MASNATSPKFEEITGISGNTISIAQPLFTNYTRSPEAIPSVLIARWPG